MTTNNHGWMDSWRRESQSDVLYIFLLVTLLFRVKIRIFEMFGFKIVLFLSKERIKNGKSKTSHDKAVFPE